MDTNCPLSITLANEEREKGYEGQRFRIFYSNELHAIFTILKNNKSHVKLICLNFDMLTLSLFI